MPRGFRIRYTLPRPLEQGFAPAPATELAPLPRAPFRTRTARTRRTQGRNAIGAWGATVGTCESHLGPRFAVMIQYSRSAGSNRTYLPSLTWGTLFCREIGRAHV